MDRTLFMTQIAQAKAHILLLEQIFERISSELEPRRDVLVEAAPAKRSCPGCGKTIMAAATRCGYCWMKLEPIEVAGRVPDDG